MKLIGFTGYAGSGKTTAAKHLVEKHGFVRIRFAGPLKDMMRALGLGEREVDGDLKEQPCKLLSGRTPRYAMQTLGTEWGRDLMHPDFWRNIAVEQICAVLDQGGRVAIDDVRFPNEVETIKGLGGDIIEIFRPSVVPNTNHASESHSLPFDRLLVNNASISWLGDMLDVVLPELEKGATR